MPQRLLLSAALLAVAAELAFASMGAVVKLASETLSQGTLVFYRNVFGLLALLPLLLRHGLPDLRTSVFHLHLVRALAGLGAMYCFFYTLSHLALAEAMVLKMTAPLFVPLVAFLWLDERLGLWAAAALATGFAGVVLILRPDLGGLSLTAVVALAGGLLAALAKTTVRRLARSEPGPRIVFYFAVIATAASSAFLPFTAGGPAAAREWLLLAAIGVLATLGQLLMTRAYALAPAPGVAPYTYASLLFATIYGWLFWDEVLAAATIIGSLLVVAAGILATLGPRPAAAAAAPLPAIARRPGEV